MQINNNYNYIECIGGNQPIGPGPGPNQPVQPSGSGMIVRRNLWSWLESTNNTYDNGTGVWTDTSGWSNNAYVSGNVGSISPNGGAFGGYSVNFGSNDWLWWANNYDDGPTPFAGDGACIFMVWEPSTTFTGSVSLFNTTNPVAPSGSSVSWWGGTNTLSGNSRFRYGWPNANGYTTAQPTPTGSSDAPYLQPYVSDNYGLNCTMWNSGNTFGLNGTQVAIKNPTSATTPTYVINNSDLTSGFDWRTYTLQFGKQNVMVSPYNGGDGTNISYPFVGNIKRILIYNTVLSPNEIARNFTYLNSF